MGSSTAATSTPPVAAPVDVKAQPKAKEAVTPQAAPAENVVREEKIEYRDQDGNLLNEDQIKALEGKVEFSTRYETRTRVLDANGNEIPQEGQSGEKFVAPPHPDVDRIPGTKGSDDEEKKDSPASASPEGDLKKEKAVDEGDAGKPRPASEAQEATVKE